MSDDSPIYALSTMWWQGRFPSLRDFARAIALMGYYNVEINYVVDPHGLQDLLHSPQITIVSLHNPVPRVPVSDGRFSEQLNLASLDEEERLQAIELGRRTLELAKEIGAKAVVFHLGHLPSPLRGEQELRRLYEQGEREGPKVEALRRQCQKERQETVEPYLAQACRSLEALAETASLLEVTIGLENRYHYHEIPTLEEMAQLLAPYPPQVVGHWHDVGHAAVLDRLGLIRASQWLEVLGSRCVGAHLHDVDGLTDHRAPGQGSVDWTYVARLLPRHALRVLEIDQRVPEEKVAGAIAFLRQQGVL